MLWIILFVVALLAARVAIPRLGKVAAGGVVDSNGQPALAQCPSSPNCRSSEATDESHKTTRISTSFASPDDALNAVSRLILAEPNTRIITRNETYLHATWRSRWMGFVDDLEVLADAPGELQVRSASRLGYADFNANGERIERLRRALESVPEG